MSNISRFGCRIEEVTSETEITIEKNIDEIKANHMKKITCLDIKYHINQHILILYTYINKQRQIVNILNTERNS